MSQLLYTGIFLPGAHHVGMAVGALHAHDSTGAWIVVHPVRAGVRSVVSSRGFLIILVPRSSDTHLHVVVQGSECCGPLCSISDGCRPSGATANNPRRECAGVSGSASPVSHRWRRSAPGRVPDDDALQPSHGRGSAAALLCAHCLGILGLVPMCCSRLPAVVHPHPGGRRARRWACSKCYAAALTTIRSWPGH